MTDRLTREYIRAERSKILLARFSSYTINRYNDGWCYNCNKPIPLEQLSKYCSERCLKKQSERSLVGYRSNVPNR